MTEKGEELGWAAVALNGKRLQILKFDLVSCANLQTPGVEAAFFMDTLMRAAASYGEAKGADFIETAGPDYNTFLKAKGFDTDSLHAFTPMRTIVHYTNK